MQNPQEQFLRYGTQLITQAQNHNIHAVLQVVDAIKSALGPNSMSKMMIGIQKVL